MKIFKSFIILTLSLISLEGQMSWGKENLSVQPILKLILMRQISSGFGLGGSREECQLLRDITTKEIQIDKKLEILFKTTKGKIVISFKSERIQLKGAVDNILRLVLNSKLLLNNPITPDSASINYYGFNQQFNGQISDTNVISEYAGSNDPFKKIEPSRTRISPDAQTLVDLIDQLCK